LEFDLAFFGIMKTTIDISDCELADAMRFTGARTKKDAISRAVADFNRRQRMARLARELRGSCPSMMTGDELRALRSSS